MVRIGDGNTAHGSNGTSSNPGITLTKVESIPDISSVSVHYDLADIKYYNGAWQYVNGSSSYNLSGYVNTPNKYNNVGRMTGNNGNEYNIAITLNQIGDTSVSFAQRMIIKGGAYEQQIMDWTIGNNPTFSSTWSSGSSFASSTMIKSNGSTPTVSSVASQYQWKNSV